MKSELDLLTERQQKLEESYRQLSEFMHSEDFVIDKNSFEEKLVAFEVNAVSAVSETPSSTIPMQSTIQSEQRESGSQPIQTTLPLPESTPKTTHLLAMAAIVVASIIVAGIFELKYPEYFMSTFGSQQADGNVRIIYHSGEILKWVAIGSALVMALPWIIDAVRRLIELRLKRTAVSPLGASWIYKNLAYIRDRHLAAHLMVKAQGGQTKDELAERMQMDEVFYNRVKYFQTSLSTEFQKILSSIFKVCDAGIWERKGLLISAIVQSRMAVGRPR